VGSGYRRRGQQDPRGTLIGSVVAEGLFVIGDLTGPDNRFAPWDTSLDDSVRRIRGEYVDRFDDLEAKIGGAATP